MSDDGVLVCITDSFTFFDSHLRMADPIEDGPYKVAVEKHGIRNPLYDCIRGETQGTNIFVKYSSGAATSYPAYVVTFEALREAI
jgi:hypothetical protein